MIYLHDIFVNWVDGGSRAHQIPEYHEWRTTDGTELMDTIPVVHVKSELYNYLEDGYIDIPPDILNQVHKESRRVNPETKRKNIVEYAFILTDGHHVMAINTEGDTKPNLKSRLVPKQEKLVLEYVADLTARHYHFVPEDYEEVDETLGGRILSLDPEYMLGLTRTEKEMKEIVMDCLFNISCSENILEVRYWFVELFPKEYSKDLILEKDWMVQKMFDFLKVGWSKQHEEFGTVLVKYYDIYKTDWAALIKTHKDELPSEQKV